MAISGRGAYALSRSRNASEFTQLFSGKPRPHSAAVTSRASCQPGVSCQSGSFRRLTRVPGLANEFASSALPTGPARIREQ
jgi:hypothetical protein